MLQKSSENILLFRNLSDVQKLFQVRKQSFSKEEKRATLLK